MAVSVLKGGLFFSAFCCAQPFLFALHPFKVHLPMQAIVEDQLKVVVAFPQDIHGNKLFRMPAVVPGTYSWYHFGRFVRHIQAYRNGQAESPTKQDQNTWILHSIEGIDSLVYWVDDTFDDTQYANWVFEPAGTNFEANQNFLLNFHGVIGYIEGEQHQRPYQIHCQVPKAFQVATGLEFQQMGHGNFLLSALNYHQLVDGPAMFSEPDMATKKLGNTEISVAVYNPSKQIRASRIMEVISPLMQAIFSYLGDSLPVKNYAFIFYLTDQMQSPGAGALEHGNSSVYYLPVIQENFLLNMVRDVAAHEFFHILTPLNLRSEDIHFFDYQNPSMSRHLWLYEGATEYASGLVQVREGLMNSTEFFDWIAQKVTASNAFNDTLAFTELSQGCLDTHKDQYLNVYQKGALNNLCLDLVLRNNSPNAETGFPELMQQLAHKFGPNKPFQDALLFQEIQGLGYHEAALFLEKYVAGAAPLPLKEMFALAGLDFYRFDTLTIRDLGFKPKRLLYDEGKKAYYISSTSDLTPVGQKAGLKPGDYVFQAHGFPLSNENDLKTFLLKWPEIPVNQRIIVKIGRPKKGLLKEKNISLPPQTTTFITGVQLQKMNSPSQKQLMVQKAWLNQ